MRRKWASELLTNTTAEIPLIWLEELISTDTSRRLRGADRFGLDWPWWKSPDCKSLYLKHCSPSHARLCWLLVVVIVPCDQAVCDSLYIMSLHRLKFSKEPRDHLVVFSTALIPLTAGSCLQGVMSWKCTMQIFQQSLIIFAVVVQKHTKCIYMSLRKN